MDQLLPRVGLFLLAGTFAGGDIERGLKTFFIFKKKNFKIRK